MSEKPLISPGEKLAQNMNSIREKINIARKNSPWGQPVTLVAVTKRHSAQVVKLLGEMGHQDLGESYALTGIEKGQEVNSSFRWHLIGHLQTNKVKKVLDFYSVIHSIDSLKLLQEVDRQANNNGKKIEILIQTNVSGEDSKYGFSPLELEGVFSLYSQLEAVKIIGLMTMAPYVDPEKTRPYFSELRQLRDKWKKEFSEVEELSMGMSNDFEVAIEEGATIVRLGTVLFEGIEG